MTLKDKAVISVIQAQIASSHLLLASGNSLALLQKISPEKAKLMKLPSDKGLLSLVEFLSKLGDEDSDIELDEDPVEVNAAGWAETLHPRSKDGKFGGGGSSSSNNDVGEGDAKERTAAIAKVDARAWNQTIEKLGASTLDLGIAATVGGAIEMSEKNQWLRSRIEQTTGEKFETIKKDNDNELKKGMIETGKILKSYTPAMLDLDISGALGMNVPDYCKALKNPKFRVEVGAVRDSLNEVRDAYSEESISRMRGKTGGSYEAGKQISKDVLNISKEMATHVRKAKSLIPRS